jgi:hypothetical protein
MDDTGDMVPETAVSSSPAPPSANQVQPAGPAMSRKTKAQVGGVEAAPKNVGGRPTSMQRAARDPTQQRLSFASPAVPTPPGPASVHHNTSKTHGATAGAVGSTTTRPEGRVFEEPNVDSEIIAARARGMPLAHLTLSLPAEARQSMSAISEGRGKTLSTDDLLVLVASLVTAMTGTLTPSAESPGTLPLHGPSRKRPRQADGSTPPPSVPVSHDLGYSTTPSTMPLGTPADPMVTSEWTTVGAAQRGLSSTSRGDQSSRSNTSIPGFDQVSVPRNQVSKTPRVSLRVALPKSTRTDSIVPPNLVVYDGLPHSLTHMSFGKILGMYHDELAKSRDMVNFPDTPMVASIHRLGQGGWTVAYSDATVAEQLLAQDSSLLAKLVEIDPSQVDIHRPGSPTKKAGNTSSRVSRTVFGHLEPETLGEMFSEVLGVGEVVSVRPPTDRVEGMATPEPAHTNRSKASGRGLRSTVGVPSKPEDRQRLEEALCQALKSPAGGHVTKVQIVGATGGMLIELSTAEAAEIAISQGLRCPSLGRRLIVRASHHPDVRGGLPFCTRCLGVGHRPHQCGEKARCRECGLNGHCAVDGRCPKGKRHPNKPKGSTAFCVCCGQDDHKAGAPSCPDLRQLRQRMARGPDGSFLAAIEQERAIRAASTSGTSAPPVVPHPSSTAKDAPRPNAWFRNAPTSHSVPVSHSETQQSQISKLERAVMAMQEQLSTLIRGLTSTPRTHQTHRIDASDMDTNDVTDERLFVGRSQSIQN